MPVSGLRHHVDDLPHPPCQARLASIRLGSSSAVDPHDTRCYPGGPSHTASLLARTPRPASLTCQPFPSCPQSWALHILLSVSPVRRLPKLPEGLVTVSHCCPRLRIIYRQRPCSRGLAEIPARISHIFLSMLRSTSIRVLPWSRPLRTTPRRLNDPQHISGRATGLPAMVSGVTPGLSTALVP